MMSELATEKGREQKVLDRRPMSMRIVRFFLLHLCLWLLIGALLSPTKVLIGPC